MIAREDGVGAVGSFVAEVRVAEDNGGAFHAAEREGGGEACWPRADDHGVKEEGGTEREGWLRWGWHLGGRWLKVLEWVGFDIVAVQWIN